MDLNVWKTNLMQGLKAIRNDPELAAASNGREHGKHALGLKCESHIRDTLVPALLERGFSQLDAEMALFSELGLNLWDRLEDLYAQDGTIKLITQSAEADELWRELAPPPGSALALARNFASQFTSLDGFDAAAYWLEKRPCGLIGMSQSRLEVLKRFEEAGVPTSSLFEPDATDIRKEQMRHFARVVLSAGLAWLRNLKGKQIGSRRAKAGDAGSIPPPITPPGPLPATVVKGALSSENRGRRSGTRKLPRRVLPIQAVLLSTPMVDWSELSMTLPKNYQGVIDFSIGKKHKGRCSFKTMGLRPAEYDMLRVLAQLSEGANLQILKEGAKKVTISRLNSALKIFFKMAELAIVNSQPLFNLSIKNPEKEELTRLRKEQSWDEKTDRILKGDPAVKQLHRRVENEGKDSLAEGAPWLIAHGMAEEVEPEEDFPSLE